MPVLNKNTKSKASFYKYKSHKLISRSDKSIQAEMKNKRELARLQLFCRVLDKQDSHSRFLIEKEKVLARRFMKQMSNTTGISAEGEPPEGSWDRQHETSPYFKGSASVSEKRFQHWKVAEAKLQREIPTVLEQEEEDTPYQAKQKMQIVMGMMGYEETDIEKILANAEKLEKQALSEKQNSKISAFFNKTAKQLNDKEVFVNGQTPDVFACLRTFVVSEEMNGISADDRKVKPKNGEFSVDKWQKDMINQYACHMTQAPHNMSKEKVRELRRTPLATIKRKYYEDRNTFETIPVSFHNETDNATKKDKLFNIKDTPLFTTSPKAIKNPTVGTNKSKSISLQPVPLRPHTSGNQRRFEILEQRPRTAMGYVSNNGEIVFNNTNDFQANTDQINDEKLDENLNDILNNYTIITDKENDYDKNIFKTLEKSYNEPKKEELLKELIQPVRQVTFGRKDSVSEKKGNSNNESTINKPLQDIQEDTRVQNRKLLVPIAPIRRPSSSDSKSSKGTVRSFKSSSTNERQFNKTSTNEKSKFNSKNSCEDCSDEDEVSEEVSATPQSTLPRWKRDLMREAPPSLYTPKQAPRVNLIMSRSQRNRELERLKDENVNNVKTICDTEQERRIRNRFSVFATMLKVRQVVETFKSKTSDYDSN